MLNESSYEYCVAMYVLPESISGIEFTNCYDNITQNAMVNLMLTATATKDIWHQTVVNVTQLVIVPTPSIKKTTNVYVSCYFSTLYM